MFFFGYAAPTEIYTLSLHDALPIYVPRTEGRPGRPALDHRVPGRRGQGRSEEHTSELQSQSNLVCRLLLEKKKDTDHHGNTADADQRLQIDNVLSFARHSTTTMLCP